MAVRAVRVSMTRAATESEEALSMREREAGAVAAHPLVLPVESQGPTPRVEAQREARQGIPAQQALTVMATPLKATEAEEEEAATPQQAEQAAMEEHRAVEPQAAAQETRWAVQAAPADAVKFAFGSGSNAHQSHRDRVGNPERKRLRVRRRASVSVSGRA